MQQQYQENRPPYHDQTCRVTHKYAAIFLSVLHVIFTIGLLIVLTFLYVDVQRIDTMNHSDGLKIVFWCLFASSFYTIFGAIGWSFGVINRKLIFFWSWLILTIPTYILLWMLFLEVHCASSQTWFLLLLPQVFLQVLPLYLAKQYYDFKIFERAESVL